MKRGGRNVGVKNSNPRSRRKMADSEKERRRKKKEVANNKAKTSFLQSIVQGISQVSRITQSHANNTAGTEDTKESPN